MKFYQETTNDWTRETPNHVYLLNDSRDRMWGYVPNNSNKLTIFKQPLPFDSRRRRLRPVPNQWNWTPPARTVPKNAVIVRGSRGDEYTVEFKSGSYRCSCSGYKFRGACRHITEVKQKNLINQS